MRPAIVKVTNCDNSFYAIIYTLDKGCRIETRRGQETYPTLCSGVQELMRLGYVRELTASQVKKLDTENVFWGP